MTIKLSKSDVGKFRQLLQADQHEMVADARQDSDSDTGPNPHDLYDAALAACKAITLLMYAEKADIHLEDVHITINRDSSEERSGQYHLQVGLALYGKLDSTQRDRLEKVAAKCPVHKLMTAATTTITTTTSCEVLNSSAQTDLAGPSSERGERLVHTRPKNWAVHRNGSSTT
jgi:putative redox protein